MFKKRIHVFTARRILYGHTDTITCILLALVPNEIKAIMSPEEEHTLYQSSPAESMYRWNANAHWLRAYLQSALLTPIG